MHIKWTGPGVGKDYVKHGGIQRRMRNGTWPAAISGVQLNMPDYIGFHSIETLCVRIGRPLEGSGCEVFLGKRSRFIWGKIGF